jgi:hypothetical protein
VNLPAEQGKGVAERGAGDLDQASERAIELGECGVRSAECGMRNAEWRVEWPGDARPPHPGSSQPADHHHQERGRARSENGSCHVFRSLC